MAHHQFRVEGMTCGGCVAAVKNVLSRQPGVSSAQVEIGKIDLELDESVGSVDAVRKAVEKAGYAVT
jgi:copper chaperone CopZ